LQAHSIRAIAKPGLSNNARQSAIPDRRAKYQAPNPQAPEKFQISSPKPQNKCRGKRRAGPFLSLELGASLELGVWNLELFAWVLSFSKIEMRPPASSPELCSLKLEP